MAKIWNQLVNTVGNVFGMSESAKRSLMYDSEGMLTDKQITKVVNTIKENLNKRKDLTQQEYNKVIDTLNELTTYSNQIGSPDLNKFVQDEKNKMIENLNKKRDKFERDLSDYDLKVNAVDAFAQDAYNLDTPSKTKGSDEYKQLKQIEDQSSKDLNNYERSIKDAI